MSTRKRPTPHSEPDEPEIEHFEEETSNDDNIGKAATIAVVGVGVALISAELLPGMLIGVAAAFLPGIGPKLRPLMKSTIRAGYSAYKKTKEMVAEASEQMQDVMAEARHESSEPAPAPKAKAHSSNV
jgi:hypothetical protein